MQTQHTTPAPETPETFTKSLLSFVSRWGLELSVVIPVGGAYLLLARKVGYWPAAWLVIGVVVLLLLIPQVREVLRIVLRLSHWMRRFDTALSMQSGTLERRRPKVVGAKEVPSGTRLTLSLRSGTTISDVASIAPYIAVHFKARNVRVKPDPQDASLVDLTLCTKDPFGSGPVALPEHEAGTRLAWGTIRAGIDEDGSEVRLSLLERSSLSGGEPGSGKSGYLHVNIAELGLDPTVTFYLFDPKGVELAPWRRCASNFVTSDMNAANKQLAEIEVEMHLRYETLQSLGLRKLQEGGPFGLMAVVIDELPYYVANSDKEASKEFATRLRDIIARGRASGIIVITAAQKPSVDTIPSAIRDLISLRLAFRCSTREASDTILGSGWATKGFSASEIAIGDRGVGLLLGKDDIPILLRAYWMNDEAIEKRVSEMCRRRTAHTREGLPNLNGTWEDA